MSTNTPAPAADASPAAKPELACATVYYDGACPMCRREIGYYREQPAVGPIEWIDISTPDASRLPPGVTREAAMARFHMTLPDGRTVDGAAAFLGLWLQLPKFRWVARLASIPPIPWLLEIGYRAFLVVRPTLQRLTRRRATD